MRILVIGPSWIGDMMMSQSLYRTLKIRYPKVIIDVMAPVWCCSLSLNMPEVNESIPMFLNHGELNINARYKLGYNLRKKCYEQAYVLPNSFKSALVPFFARIPTRIGWRGEMRYGLLNDVRVLDETVWPLMVERYVALAYEKNIMRSAQDLPNPLPWPRLQINNDEKIYTSKVFNISFEYQIIGLCPGAELGYAKRWPHYHFAKLAKKLIDEGYQILLFGSKKDHEVGNRILAAVSKNKPTWCHNLIGKTKLEQAVILISLCKAIVTNDSGLMHVAAALDCPLVALYGPTTPDFTPPLSNRVRVVRLITGHYKAYKDYNPEKYHQSLINITPKHVLETLKELLLREEKK